MLYKMHINKAYQSGNQYVLQVKVINMFAWQQRMIIFQLISKYECPHKHSLGT